MKKRIDLFELLIVIIVTIGVLVMTGCLYLDILLMQRMDERLAEVEAVISEIEISVPEVASEEPVEEITEPTAVYFDIPLDESLQDHIFAECERYGVEPAVVVAMIERESGFRESVVGDSGRSFGLMQIQPKWHSGRMEKLGCDDLLDPYQNVTVGIDFLAELIGYEKGVEWALMAYNGGPGYANKLRGEGRVSDYAAGVMASSREKHGL